MSGEKQAAHTSTLDVLDELIRLIARIEACTTGAVTTHENGWDPEITWTLVYFVRELAEEARTAVGRLAVKDLGLRTDKEGGAPCA